MKDESKNLTGKLCEHSSTEVAPVGSAHSSTGRRSQNSLTTPPHHQPALTRDSTGKSGFEENNTSDASERRSAAYINVREHSSTGRRSQDSLTTRFPLGVYIHWPYCLTKCPYCDFFSSVKKCQNEDDLIKSYEEDLEFYRNLNNNYEVKSIFFGGGTPSLIKPQNIERIINRITKLWACAPNLEVSLEANPNSNHPQMFRELKSAGINRLSLGIQALNEEDLHFLGRSHTLNEALKAVDEVVSTFDNHSVDLIYARPHQQLKSWEQELRQVVSFGLRHISLYQLTIEEKTVFAHRGIEALNEDDAAIMYDFTLAYLNQHGYPQYEVSNFGKPCVHNCGYWQGYDYVGVGKGAHGRLHIDNKIYETTHHRHLELLTPEERAEELVIMGLRLLSGINKHRFYQECGLDFEQFINLKNLQNLRSENLIIDTKDTLRPTCAGLKVLNKIIEELCC